MKFIILQIAILFLSVITITGQSKLIIPLDSNYFKIHKDEIKYITVQFIELSAVRVEKKLLNEQINVYKRIVDDKDKIIDIRNQLIDNLKEQLEDQRPSWWNKFSYGLATGAVIILTILLAVK